MFLYDACDTSLLCRWGDKGEYRSTSLYQYAHTQEYVIRLNECIYVQVYTHLYARTVLVLFRIEGS